MAVLARRHVLAFPKRSVPPLTPVFSNSIDAFSASTILQPCRTATLLPLSHNRSPHGKYVEHYGISSRISIYQAHRGSLYQLPLSSYFVGVRFSTEVSKDAGNPTDTVLELYKKIASSIEAKTMSPNAWLWSLIENCANKEDIELLFQILEKLRTFRLSRLGIYANFNSHLCMRIAESCARVGAINYGLRTLYKHNIYGLTPTIGSAHYLLAYAKEHKDVNVMIKIMRALRRNSLPLQPGTADIVFSICSIANDWPLISLYAEKFIKAGVKLHRTAFDIWMEFAAKVGDVEAIKKIDKLRSMSTTQHTIMSAFSVAKGHLLEGEPENAASIIYLLYQSLPDEKKCTVLDELQKLVSGWPRLVMKKKDRKKITDAVTKGIPVMVTSLFTLVPDFSEKLENLKPALSS